VHLDDLFKIITNLEKLSLSILYLPILEALQFLEVIKTLEEFHLEIREYSYKTWHDSEYYKINFKVL